MQGVREFGCGIFSTSLQPLDTFSGKTLQTQFTVQFGRSETILSSWVLTTSGHLVKLYSLRGIAATAPALFVTRASTISSIRMTTLASLDKVRISKS